MSVFTIVLASQIAVLTAVELGEYSPEDCSATLSLEFALRSSACCSANYGWKISPSSSVGHFSLLWVNYLIFILSLK